jgi:pseudouridine kinase
MPPIAPRSPAGRPAPSAGGIIVLGGCNVDLSGRADGAMVPGDSSPGEVRRAAGGVARNVAENLARLGHAVRLVSCVGQDAAGRWLRRTTAEAGVDIGGCRAVRDGATAHYLSLHGPDGRLLGAVNDMAVLNALTPERLARERRHLQSAAAIVVDANLSAAALQWLFEQDLPAPVFADAVSAVKASGLKPWLGRLHLLKLNRAEARALGAGGLDTHAERRACAAALLDAGVRQVALSLGPDGLWLADRSGHAERPAWPVPARNATGAGDALLAGLVHATLAGWPGPRAADFALGCAALTISHPETNYPGLSLQAVQRLQRRCRRPQLPRSGPSRARGLQPRPSLDPGVPAP